MIYRRLTFSSLCLSGYAQLRYELFFLLFSVFLFARTGQDAYTSRRTAVQRPKISTTQLLSVMRSSAALTNFCDLPLPLKQGRGVGGFGLQSLPPSCTMANIKIPSPTQTKRQRQKRSIARVRMSFFGGINELRRPPPLTHTVEVLVVLVWNRTYIRKHVLFSFLIFLVCF